METINSYTVENYSTTLVGCSFLNQDVSVFDFGSVLVQKNYKDYDRVRLISGGTLSLINFVGMGMLTATIQDENNKSPTGSVILRTIRELSLNHAGGLLIIVPAFSSDILSFGLATERALNDDLQVMLLAVADDYKNKNLPNSEKKGLCGIILIIKIAGVLSEQGKALSFIHDYCSKVMTNLTSNNIYIPTSLDLENCTECNICKNTLTSNIPAKKLKRSAGVLSDFTRDLLDELIKTVSLNPGDNCVVLVNNIGPLKQNEEYMFALEINLFLKTFDVRVSRLYIGQYLYINDINLSITLLKVFDEEVLKYLDSPCTAPGWKPVHQSSGNLSEHITHGLLKRKCRLSPPIKGPKLRDRPSNVVQLCLQFACEALISCEKMLNKIDSEKGDGDTGTRLKIVAEVLLRRGCNKKLQFVFPFTFFLCLSKLLENAVGGTLGCIYSIMFEAAANKFGEYKEDDEVSYKMWVEALENAVNAFQRYGNVNQGENTMFDPLAACIDTLKQNLTDTNILDALGKGVSKAEETAAHTVKTGCKYPDAGAHAVGIWLRAVYEGIKLRIEHN